VTTASVESGKAAVRERTLVDRLLAAFPVLALALGVLIFYAVEAWLRHTPWVFTDELEWTQISRSIASTGHAARRGEPINFKSLYPYTIAPFWWIHSTSAAYAAVKYANVVIMTLAAVPTYLLARMLVSRRAAMFVAVLAVAVPGMAYVTTIVPEVLAYPYYALCSWLIVRAFASGSRNSRRSPPRSSSPAAGSGSPRHAARLFAPTGRAATRSARSSSWSVRSSSSTASSCNT
jgi:hypothetical protein